MSQESLPRKPLCGIQMLIVGWKLCFRAKLKILSIFQFTSEEDFGIEVHKLRANSRASLRTYLKEHLRYEYAFLLGDRIMFFDFALIIRLRCKIG